MNWFNSPNPVACITIYCQTFQLFIQLDLHVHETFDNIT